MNSQSAVDCVGYNYHRDPQIDEMISPLLMHTGIVHYPTRLATSWRWPYPFNQADYLQKKIKKIEIHG